MSKCVLMLGVGLIMGAYLGYANEEEIDEMAHLMHKNQKKMSRKAHRAYRTICSCMDHGCAKSRRKKAFCRLFHVDSCAGLC